MKSSHSVGIVNQDQLHLCLTSRMEKRSRVLGGDRVASPASLRRMCSKPIRKEGRIRRVSQKRCGVGCAGREPHCRHFGSSPLGLVPFQVFGARGTTPVPRHRHASSSLLFRAKASVWRPYITSSRSGSRLPPRFGYLKMAKPTLPQKVPHHRTT